MRKPWTLTIVLGLLGLVALPVLISSPALLKELATESQVRPFVLYLASLFFASLVWLVAFVWAVFRHQGRTRTILLACTAAVLVAGLAVDRFAARQTVKLSIDLPPAHLPLER